MDYVRIAGDAGLESALVGHKDAAIRNCAHEMPSDLDERIEASVRPVFVHGSRQAAPSSCWFSEQSPPSLLRTHRHLHSLLGLHCSADVGTASVVILVLEISCTYFGMHQDS